MNNINKIIYATIVALITFFIFFFFLKPNVQDIQLHAVSYTKLSGWGKTNLLPSMAAFQISCKFFLNAPPKKIVGNDIIKLNVSDWLPACNAATLLDTPHTQKQIKHFFETWFTPVEFYKNQPVQGLFTGYYVPSVQGSLTKTPEYTTPIYGVPDDLITIALQDFDPVFKKRKLIGRISDSNRLVPYYTSEEIDQGALAGHAAVIAWIHSRVDRLFLQIQGSGIIELPDGSALHINYAAENGAPYTAIGKILIKKGVMTTKTASMQTIRHYLNAHPADISPILNANKSFVFFKASKKPAALGVQNIKLTPGYSMAVDLQWIPTGVPIWLDTTRPDHNKKHRFHRLMIAQDTGGAIRGPVRGDVFWGTGLRAAAVAGEMKQPGYYWILLPKKIA